MEILTIIAILLGPIIAVQLTRYLDEKKEVRERKLRVFKTLMATRATNLSPLHVEALNLIDLEFSHKSDRPVIEAWKAYLDLLGDTTALTGEAWATRRLDLQLDLLHKMALNLGYQFDKTTIKNSSYYPTLHGTMEADQHVIRGAVKELLAGQRALGVHITRVDQP